MFFWVCLSRLQINEENSRKNKTQKHNDIMRFKSCWEGRKLTNQRITLPVHILQGRKLQTSRYFYAYDDIDCPSLDSIKMLGAIYSKKSLNGSYKFIDQFRNRNLHLTSITQSSIKRLSLRTRAILESMVEKIKWAVNQTLNCNIESKNPTLKMYPLNFPNKKFIQIREILQADDFVVVSVFGRDIKIWQWKNYF